MKHPKNMDIAKINPLHQKRTLAFVNHFLVTNVQFLNNFMKNCEAKLMQFERKLEKVTAAVVLLESRLSSIPEVNTPSSTTETKEPNVENLNESKETVPIENSAEPEPPNEDVDVPDNRKPSPEYDRFIKMVHVGVPLQAAKLKASLEGLDPNILEELLK